MNQHEAYIRQSIELATSAARKGNHPFGALLVHEDKVIMTAENTVTADNDSTRHAELNLIVKSERKLSPEVLRECTLYTSTAPCLMCTAVIWNAGINRIVYSVSYESLARLVSGNYSYIRLDEIYKQLGTGVEFLGPVLEMEGVEAYKFWPDR
jgi:tRNA(Arg) A34 adenosine deaminase TadA